MGTPEEGATTPRLTTRLRAPIVLAVVVAQMLIWLAVACHASADVVTGQGQGSPLMAFPTGISRDLPATAAPVAGTLFTADGSAWTGWLPGSQPGTLESIWTGTDPATSAGLLTIATGNVITEELEPATIVQTPAGVGAMRLLTGLSGLLVLQSSGDGAIWVYNSGSGADFIGPFATGASISQVLSAVQPVVAAEASASTYVPYAVSSGVVARLLSGLEAALGSLPTAAPYAPMRLLHTHVERRAAAAPRASAASGSDITGLNDEEKAYCFSISHQPTHLAQCVFAYEDVANDATVRADELFGVESVANKGRGAAYRHCYWVGAMAWHLGQETALGFGFRHVDGSGEDQWYKNMGFNNNWWGAYWSPAYTPHKPSWSQEEHARDVFSAFCKKQADEAAIGPHPGPTPHPMDLNHYPWDPFGLVAIRSN